MLKTERSKEKGDERVLTIKELHGVVEKGAYYDEKKGEHNWLTVQFRGDNKKYAFSPTVDDSKIKIFECLGKGQYKETNVVYEFKQFINSITEDSYSKILAIFNHESIDLEQTEELKEQSAA